MKRLLNTCLSGLIGLAFLSSCGSTHSDITSFYKSHRRGENITNITLPKWIIRLGGGIAANQLDDEEKKLVKPLIKKVNKVRLLISEEGALWSEEEHKAFKNQLTQSGFEEYIQVRDGATRLQFMMNEVDNQFKDIVIFFLDEEESGMIAIRSKISIQDLAKVIEHYIQQNKPEPIEEPEPPKKKAIAQA